MKLFYSEAIAQLRFRPLKAVRPNPSFTENNRGRYLAVSAELK